MSIAQRLVNLSDGLSADGVLGPTKGGVPTGGIPDPGPSGDVLMSDGTVWISQAGVSGSATISDTAPASPSEGSLWLDSTTGDLYIYTSGAWVLPNGGSSGGGTAGATGPAGPTGPTGSQGITGPTGPAGEAATGGGGGLKYYILNI